MKKILIGLFMVLSAVLTSSISSAATLVTGEQNFKDITKDGGNFVIMLSAESCSACKIAMPMFEDVESNLKDSATFLIIDVDKNPELNPGVPATPVFLLLSLNVQTQKGAGIILEVGVPPSTEVLEKSVKKAIERAKKK